MRKFTLKSSVAELYTEEDRALIAKNLHGGDDLRVAAVLDTIDLDKMGDFSNACHPTTCYFDTNGKLIQTAIVATPSNIRERAGAAYFVAFGCDRAEIPLTTEIQAMTASAEEEGTKFFVYMMDYGAMVISATLVKGIIDSAKARGATTITEEIVSKHVRLIRDSRQSAHRFIQALPHANALIAGLIKNDLNIFGLFATSEETQILNRVYPDLTKLQIEFCA